MPLSRREKELRRRIGQSMSDTGSYNPTKKCRNLQRALTKVQCKRRNKNRRWK